LEENLISWVQRISEKKDKLGGFSICPFAKKALEDKKIFWSSIAYECESYILRYIESLRRRMNLVDLVYVHLQKKH